MTRRRNDKVKRASTAVSSSASKATLATLCLCMLTQSYLLISVFSYAGYLVLHLDNTNAFTADTAGQAAGWLAAGFMAGRALTAVAWGHVADRYGRTTVLYTSLVAAAILSIAFGLVPSYTAALVTRFLLGAFNGILGTVKTLVSELAPNAKQEATWMTTVIGMWSWGFLVSPGLAGFLADPLHQYNSETLSWMPSWLRQGLQHFPFVLPNLVAAVLCFVSFVAVACFVPETLSRQQRKDNELSSCSITWWNRVFGRRSQSRRYLKAHASDIEMTTRHNNLEIDTDCDNKEDDNNRDATNHNISMAAVWARPSTRRILLVYWFNSFLVLTADEVFPLFCMSPSAGLGFVEHEIGQVLSACGLLFCLSQYHLYQAVHCRHGLMGTLRRGATAATPFYAMVPLSVCLWQSNNDNDETSSPSHSWPVVAFLAIVLAAHKVASLLFFSSISVAINRSVAEQPSLLATTNGLSMLGGSAAKAAGPIVAGSLVTQSIAWFPGQLAAWVIYGVLTALGSLLAYATWTCLPHIDGQEQRNGKDDVDEVMEMTTTKGAKTYKMVSVVDKDDTTTGSEGDEDDEKNQAILEESL